MAKKGKIPPQLRKFVLKKGETLKKGKGKVKKK